MEEILLVAVNARYMHPAFSLRRLKANLGELEPRCMIREYVLRSPIEEIIGDIRSSRARIIGISVYIWNHGYIRKLLETLRSLREPLPAIVLGGPEASYLPDDSPLLRLADIVVRGEGEAAFRKLCEEILSGYFPFPVWKEGVLPLMLDGGLADLAAAASPYHLYTDDDLAHNRFVYVESAKGCPFACEFCLSSLDPGLRYFDEGTFLEEMRILIRRGARRIKFLDRTFNADIDRAVRIASFFLAELPFDGFVHFEMVPEFFPPELKEVLARFEAGKLRLEIGIQTFNPDVARRIGRFQDMKAALDNLSWLRCHTNAVVHADLIAGLPGEDMESFGRGFDLLWTLRPGEIQLGLLKKLPGARIAGHDAEWEMNYQKEPPYRIISNKSMSLSELEELSIFAKYWELVVNRGRFAKCIPELLPEGFSAFGSFRKFSAAAFERFGRTHSIDLGEFGAFINSYR